MIERWVDIANHPLVEPAFADRCRVQLDSDGAIVLKGFFTDEFVSTALAEFADRSDDAFYAESTHNVWLTEADDELGADHVFNRQVVSTKGLLADDQLAATSPLKAVYEDGQFRSFVAGVVGTEAVYAYADDVSSVNVHFHNDGQELGWHFDNSSFAVTTLLQAPVDGGRFEYVAGLRDAAHSVEDYPGVAAVLDATTAPRTLDFAPRDLVVFRGRNSIHRVTPSVGERPRILVVFAFNDEPGIGLSPSARATFYGR